MRRPRRGTLECLIATRSREQCSWTCCRREYCSAFWRSLSRYSRFSSGWALSWSRKVGRSFLPSPTIGLPSTRTIRLERAWCGLNCHLLLAGVARICQTRSYQTSSRWDMQWGSCPSLCQCRPIGHRWIYCLNCYLYWLSWSEHRQGPSHQWFWSAQSSLYRKLSYRRSAKRGTHSRRPRQIACTGMQFVQINAI